MISRENFNYGIDLLCGTFNRKISNETRDTWFKLVAPDFTEEEWVYACNATVREDESFPSNFVRAMRSRIPKKIAREEIPIDNDTGTPITTEEAARNRNRINALLQIMAHGKDDVSRKRTLACAEASLLEGDGYHNRKKWGAHIEQELDAYLETMSK